METRVIQAKIALGLERTKPRRGQMGARHTGMALAQIMARIEDMGNTTCRPMETCDTHKVASLIYENSKGKSTLRICTNRVGRAVNYTKRRESPGIALVTETEGNVDGYLFAHQSPAFELAESIRVYSIVFLVGKNRARLLLDSLRKTTNKRIICVGWHYLIDEERMTAFRRLLRQFGFDVAGSVYMS